MAYGAKRGGYLTYKFYLVRGKKAMISKFQSALRVAGGWPLVFMDLMFGEINNGPAIYALRACGRWFGIQKCHEQQEEAVVSPLNCVTRHL